MIYSYRNFAEAYESMEQRIKERQNDGTDIKPIEYHLSVANKVFVSLIGFVITTFIVMHFLAMSKKINVLTCFLSSRKAHCSTGSPYVKIVIQIDVNAAPA